MYDIVKFINSLMFPEQYYLIIYEYFQIYLYNDTIVNVLLLFFQINIYIM